MRQRICSLLLLLSLALSLALPAAAAGEMNFSDVKSDDWYYQYVKDLYDLGVVDGTTATTYSPQRDVTFGQALKLILISAGYEAQDPISAHWASGYYYLAQQMDFLPSGLSLALDDPISRLQIAQIVVKVMGLSRTSQDPSPFADCSDEAALILYDHGIFQGTQADQQLLFQPQDTITRAEITTVVWRIYAYTNETPHDPEVPEEPEEPETPENPRRPPQRRPRNLQSLPGSISTLATRRSMWWTPCPSGAMTPPCSSTTPMGT